MMHLLAVPLLPPAVCVQGMVRVSVDQFLAGTDLFRLQLQQSMAGGHASSPCLPCTVAPMGFDLT